MPPRPSHRLDVLLVPPDTAGAVAQVRALYEAWVAEGFVLGNRAGPRVDELMTGGFRHVRLDEPGTRVLYANQQGGFHVRCAHCSTPMAEVFEPLGQTRCPGCGVSSTVEQLDCRPSVAVSHAALVLGDAQDSVVRGVPEGWRVVWRRVSA